MIAVVNLSTVVSHSAATAMVDACRNQVITHVAPAWSRLPAQPKLYDNLNTVPSRVPLVVLVDDSDQADAFGYHTMSGDGRVVGVVAANPVLAVGGDMLAGRLTVSSVLSHEIIEAHLDPWCTSWAQAPDGRLWAWEMADPCQSDSYEIGGVSVSNFVCPRFWDHLAPEGARLDWLGTIARPFSLADGGYAVVMSGGVTSYIGAARPPWKVPSRSPRRIALGATA